MADLSEIGRKLVDAAMRHDEPPPVDESWGTLVSRITADAPQEVEAEAQPRREGAARRTGLVIAVVALALVCAALVAWWRSENEPPSATPAPPISRAPVTVPAPADPPRDRAAPVWPPADRLLPDAEAALQAGDPERALALLERHADVAPLADEAPHRMALRILVLCELERDAEARDEARAFLSGHPSSPWRGQVERSCAAP